jgi:hypothetical protein
MFSKQLLLIVVMLITTTSITLSQGNYFYPNSGNFNSTIPTPEQFLGYAIGTHHTRHDRIVEYFRELDRLSDRMTTKFIGKTFEERQQITAVFTSHSNHQRLEEIRMAHLAGQSTGNTEQVPLVIHLGYNVHGNEAYSLLFSCFRK